MKFFSGAVILISLLLGFIISPKLVNEPTLDQAEQLLRQSLEVSNVTTNDIQSDTTYIKDSCIIQKNDSGNTTDYYTNIKDYKMDSAAGKKSGLDYIPITYGSGKFVPLK